MRPKTDSADIIRGLLPLTFITLNLVFWIIPLILLALAKLVIPVSLIKRGIYQLMLAIYAAACQIDIFLFKRILGIRFDFDLPQELERDKNHLIISNHQSWADILVFQSILINRTPIIKFIVKKELLFLPLVGLICWAYEYPMVHRRSFKKDGAVKPNRKIDLEILESKLGGLTYHAASIINFAEGTRFNLEKHEKYGSPHKNLLRARTGGLFFILDTFGDKIDYLLDFTIMYDCEEPVFFKFLGRKCKAVKIQANRISLYELLPELSNETGQLEFEKVDAWLKIRWLEKDRQLDLLSPN